MARHTQKRRNEEKRNFLFCKSAASGETKLKIYDVLLYIGFVVKQRGLNYS